MPASLKSGFLFFLELSQFKDYWAPRIEFHCYQVGLAKILSCTYIRHLCFLRENNLHAHAISKMNIIRVARVTHQNNVITVKSGTFALGNAKTLFSLGVSFLANFLLTLFQYLLQFLVIIPLGSEYLITLTKTIMDTQERVLTALRCEQPDTVPVFIYLNPYVESWYAQDESYADVLRACKEYADVIYDWHFPSGFLHTAAQIPSESRQLSGGMIEHIRHTPAGPITMITKASWRGSGTVKRWITQPEDVERIFSIPFVPPRPDLTEFFDIKERLSGKCVAQVTFADPICIAGLVDEMVMAIWTIEHRDLIKRMLDVAFERLLYQLKYCLDNNVGPIYYFNGPEYALPPLMSPDDFDEFVLEYDTKLIELIHSYPEKYVIVHSHGRVSNFLEKFAGMGLDGLNVLEPPPIGDTILSDAKARIGERVCLIGNIQYDDLARGSEKKIEQFVIEAVAQGAAGGGFILSPCASPYERPLPQQASKNFIHYLKIARKYGKY